jgi:hypothetical protein
MSCVGRHAIAGIAVHAAIRENASMERSFIAEIVSRIDLTVGSFIRVLFYLCCTEGDN